MTAFYERTRSIHDANSLAGVHALRKAPNMTKTVRNLAIVMVSALTLAVVGVGFLMFGGR